MVLHDLNQACRYADYLVAVKDGRIFAAGEPKLVMSEQTKPNLGSIANFSAI